jgi:hypothetical protein
LAGTAEQVAVVAVVDGMEVGWITVDRHDPTTVVVVVDVGHPIGQVDEAAAMVVRSIHGRELVLLCTLTIGKAVTGDSKVHRHLIIPCLPNGIDPNDGPTFTFHSFKTGVLTIVVLEIQSHKTHEVVKTYSLRRDHIVSREATRFCHCHTACVCTALSWNGVPALRTFKKGYVRHILETIRSCCCTLTAPW